MKEIARKKVCRRITLKLFFYLDTPCEILNTLLLGNILGELSQCRAKRGKETGIFLSIDE